jgi:hypothetical protein
MPDLSKSPDYPTFTDIGGETTLIRRYLDPSNPAWSAFNCSVLKSNEGEYWLAFRSSNYQLRTDGNTILTAESKIRNEMYLVRLIPETWQFDEPTLRKVDITRLRSGVTRNIEDPRLFWDGTNYCISATFLERDVPVARLCKVTLKSLEDPEALDLEVYPSRANTIEKNWMPKIRVENDPSEPIDFLYRSGVVFVDGEFIDIPTHPSTLQYRGGTQLLPLEDGTSIGLIHHLYYLSYPIFNPTTFASKQSMRQYTHRFVLYNQKHEIIKVSKKFLFLSEGIEFAAGIAEHNDNFIVSFGRSDIASYMATINKQKVFDMLEDING